MLVSSGPKQCPFPLLQNTDMYICAHPVKHQSVVVLNCQITYPFLEMGNRPGCNLAICAHPTEHRNVVIISYDTRLRILEMGNPPSCNLAISGISKQTPTKSEVAASPLPCPGLKGGRKCYATPTFLCTASA